MSDDEFFASLTTAEIRRRQVLCAAQIKRAHEQRNDLALASLRRMEAALLRAMLARA